MTLLSSSGALLSVVRVTAGIGLLVLGLSGCLAKRPASEVAASSVRGGTAQAMASFELKGKAFCFGGANSYYPIQQPQSVIDELFAAAQSMNLKVMRVWGMLDIGSLDGSVPHADASTQVPPIYFQYFDGARNEVMINTGANGLQQLDRVIDSAARHGVLLIVVLVNNWSQFGGMDQYVIWHKKKFHHEFYTDSEIRRSYKRWVNHLISRTNTVNGRVYREDPTLFAWELANEPRTVAAAGRDSRTGWDENTITSWADEMSSYVKSLDPNHMVAVGDEGFLNTGGRHWAYAAPDGVDHRSLSALQHVDFGTFHLYPDDWGTTHAWGNQWIEDHLKVAQELGKPTILEEYGTKVTRKLAGLGEVVQGLSERTSAYQSWNDTLLRHGGGSSLVWMLAAGDREAFRYPDYDGFTFWSNSPTGELAGRMARRLEQAPVCQAPSLEGASGSEFVRVRTPDPAPQGALSSWGW